jgi:hypothetical protein
MEIPSPPINTSFASIIFDNFAGDYGQFIYFLRPWGDDPLRAYTGREVIGHRTVFPRRLLRTCE